MKPSARPAWLTTAIALAAFVVLGLPDGLLGIAWPSIQSSLNVSLDDLGWLVLSSAAGFLITSFFSGRLLQASRSGMGSYLLVSSAVRAGAILVYALAPSWPILIAAALFAGAGGGALDAGINTYFAVNRSPRLMNWLHACFGLGVTIGPAIMTPVLEAGWSWRWAYVVAVVLLILVAAAFGLTRRHWQDLEMPVAERSSGAQARDTLKMPMAWLGVGLFFACAGIEMTAGQWSFTLFTVGRSVPVSVAGFWVGAYWAGFTAGRVLFGIFANRFSVIRSLRLAMLGTVVGSVLLWWNPLDAGGLIGLALLGFALGPVYPLLAVDTPRRLGRDHVANAIGFQTSAGGLGVAVLPAVAGLLAGRLTLEIIGPILVAVCLAMCVLGAASSGRAEV